MLYDAEGFALALGPAEGPLRLPRFFHIGFALGERADVLALRERLRADGVEIVEESDEPDYCSVKCRDPDGFVIEAAWEVPP